MPAITVADCQTADEVYAKAREVVRRRRAREVALGRLAVSRNKLANPVSVPEVLPISVEKPRLTEAQLCQLVGSHEQQVRNKIAEIDQARLQTKKAVTINEIQLRVCTAFGITMIDLTGRALAHKYTHPRQISCLLCRILLGKSLPVIGRAHGRDHTTTLYSVTKLEWLRQALNAELALDDPIEKWVERAKHHYDNNVQRAAGVW
jgi:hypothetical protein